VLAGAHANVKGLGGQFSVTPPLSAVLLFKMMGTIEPELVSVAVPVTVQLPITAGWNIPDPDPSVTVSVSLVAVKEKLLVGKIVTGELPSHCFLKVHSIT